jgi:D-alanyl-D-alanine endopeptidase (penicillin-binding protein 7)
MRKPFLLALLLAVLGATVWWRLPVLMGDAAPQVANAPPPPVAPQAAQAAASQPARTVEEVHESADAESGLDRILPRRSVGHAAGLDKTRDSLGLASSAALVLDARSKEVLYGKNPDVVLPMASITKLMTAMVVLEANLPMDTPITIAEEDVDKVLSSRSRLRVGTVLSRGEALQLALMSSENRASHAIARTSPAGLDAFVAAMNRKAKQLAMASTTFVDPTGLSSSNQSSARDLATLVLAASAHPLIRDYSTTREHHTQMGNRILRYRNSDPLIKDESWDISLQKTGYIIEAGHCVVLRTKLAGQDVVMVLLDSASNGRRSADARRIRRWIAGDAVSEKPQATAAAPRKQADKASARKQAAKAKSPEKVAKAKATQKGKRVQASFDGSNTRKSGGPGKQ